MKKIIIMAILTFFGISNSMVLSNLDVKGVSVTQHTNGWFYLVVIVSDVVVEGQTIKGSYYPMSSTGDFSDYCKSLIANAKSANASGKKIKAKITTPGGNITDLNTFLSEYPPSTIVRQADWLLVAE